MVTIKCIQISKGTLKPVKCPKIQGICMQHPQYKVIDTELTHSMDPLTSSVCLLDCTGWESIFPGLCYSWSSECDLGSPIRCIPSKLEFRHEVNGTKGRVWGAVFPVRTTAGSAVSWNSWVSVWPLLNTEHSLSQEQQLLWLPRSVVWPKKEFLDP